MRLGNEALCLLARVHYGQLVPGGLALSVLGRGEPASKVSLFYSARRCILLMQPAGMWGCMCAGSATAVWHVLACAWDGPRPLV